MLYGDGASRTISLMALEFGSGSLTAALGLLGVGIPILLPNKKWIGLLFIAAAVPVFFFDIHISNSGITAGPPDAPPAVNHPPVSPEVTMRFTGPAWPMAVLTNESDVVARQIKWEVVLFNMDDLRTYPTNPTPNPSPNFPDPLPIPIQTFDFIRPHSSGGAQDILTPAKPYIRSGQTLFGSAIVICPDCSRGHTYILSVTVGKGGWYAEVPEQTNGNLIIPSPFTRTGIETYYKTLSTQIPDAKRHPISQN